MGCDIKLKMKKCKLIIASGFALLFVIAGIGAVYFEPYRVLLSVVAAIFSCLTIAVCLMKPACGAESTGKLKNGLAWSLIFLGSADVLSSLFFAFFPQITGDVDWTLFVLSIMAGIALFVFGLKCIK